MGLTITPALEAKVAELKARGDFSSSEDVMHEALRLLEAQAAHTAALRDMLRDAINRGGQHSDEDVATAIADALDAP